MSKSKREGQRQRKQFEIFVICLHRTQDFRVDAFSASGINTLPLPPRPVSVTCPCTYLAVHLLSNSSITLIIHVNLNINIQISNCH